jgi:prepilin peptidase CpaA
LAEADAKKAKPDRRLIMDLSVLTLAALIFPVCVIYGGVSDLMSMTIPNWVVGALVVGFMVLAPLFGLDLKAIGLHWAVALAVLAIGFACFSMGWMGGGDAKFAAAIVLWFGPLDGVAFVAFSAVFGGALTILLLLVRRSIPQGVFVVLRAPWLDRLHRRDEGVPYGIALAAAALVLYPHTAWVALVS